MITDNSRVLKRILVIYLVLLPIPLYFYLDGKVYNDSQIVQSAARVLPVSFYFTIIVGGLIGCLCVSRCNFSKFDLFFLSVCLVMIVTYLLSVIFINSETNPELLCIYLLPQIFSYVIGKSLYSQILVEKIFRVIWLSTTVFCMIEMLALFLQYGIAMSFQSRGSLSILNFMTIYGAYISYPSLLSVVLFIGLVTKEISKKSKWLGVFCISLAIIISGAREPWAMLAFMLVIYYVFCLRLPVLVLFIKIVGWIFVGILFILFLGLFIDFHTIPLVAKVLTMNNSPFGLAEGLTAGRLMIWEQFFDYFFAHPYVFLFGSGFSLSKIYFEGTFHNQWLDLISQGGIFYATGVLFLLAVSVRNLFSQSHKNTYYIVMAVILLAEMLVSFNINTNLRTSYISTLIWLLVGYSSGLTQKQVDLRCKNMG